MQCLRAVRAAALGNWPMVNLQEHHQLQIFLELGLGGLTPSTGGKWRETEMKKWTMKRFFKKWWSQIWEKIGKEKGTLSSLWVSGLPTLFRDGLGRRDKGFGPGHVVTHFKVEKVLSLSYFGCRKQQSNKCPFFHHMAHWDFISGNVPDFFPILPERKQLISKGALLSAANTETGFLFTTVLRKVQLWKAKLRLSSMSYDL